MKVLIVGYGSMGRRRIRLIKEIQPDAEFVCVDNNPQRVQQIVKDGLHPFSELKKALLFKPEVAFVCTSPGKVHADIILELIKSGIDTFTELNLCSDKYDEIIQLAKRKNVRLFMSSTMLYDEQIISICDAVHNTKEPLVYIYHVGQYLPDWHPWENYKDFFIGKKETNGCREIFAIQLPWIVEAFGKINGFNVISGKNSLLDIDFNDNYIVSFTHEGQHRGVFVVDVLARKAVTYLEIVGEKLHIFWHGTPDSLHQYDIKNKKMTHIPTYPDIEHIQGYADMVTENVYKDEIKAFFDWIAFEKEPRYKLEDDKYILNIIDKIEGLL